MDDRLLRGTYEKLKALVRKAEYEGPQARQLAAELRRALPKELRLVNPNSEQQIKALVLLAEVWDYYGMFDAAKQASAPATWILSLNTPPPKQSPKDELTQSKVRLMVAYARSLYRAPVQTPVIDVLLACREYVGKHLANDYFPCYGTLGEISYTLGRAYRQRQRFTEALGEFTEAIRLYEERAVRKEKADPKGADEAIAFSAHKVAVILALGISWCNYTQGALSTAIYANLIPASAILRRSKDILNRAYADVLRASIVRALTGKDTAKLGVARKRVEAAREIFRDYGHTHYAAGAALELALLALAERKHVEARQHLGDLRMWAENGDFRWSRSSLILESRILRHEGNKEESRSVATRAYDLAKDQQELLGQIDALVARSESCDPRAQRDAIEDLLAALELNGNPGNPAWAFNPKVHGVCHLHLVLHYLKLGRTYEALASFVEWEKVRNRVEHKSIHQLADQVATMLDRCERVEFRAADGLNYKANSRRLREFLLRQARLRHPTQEGMARTLGISRTLLNEWLAEFRIGSNPPKGGQKL